MHSISVSRSLKSLGYFAGVFLGLSIGLRFAFLVWSRSSLLQADVIWVFAKGLFFDIAALSYAVLPFLLFIAVFPPFRSQESLRKWFRIGMFGLHLTAIFVFLILSASEVTFWNEFQSRFNFIAVDYLVYTHEVLRNLWESFPIGWALAAILASSALLSRFITTRMEIASVRGYAAGQRLACLSIAVALGGSSYFGVPAEIGPDLKTHALEEVSKNGIHSLFSAYFANELNFERFYLSHPIDESFAAVRSRLKEDGELSSVRRSIAREIGAQGSFRRLNVVLVSMESMSASFMNAFGSKLDLTPNLDRLSKEGLFFNQIFATGTRTVRGLEALTLSIPPTPGQSILRRPRNENQYNLGDYFEDSDYAVDFLYGGYGYFDNMNAFFGSNGFEIIDQAKIEARQVTFKNAWGVCDEDLFAAAIRSADSRMKAGKHFFQLIMTTSNHRPYTYPNKIDIPSGTGREGAVKYADYSIGEFLKKAEEKPWFKDTIFVFVADHDASVAGGIEVPVKDFRIPFIVYSPGRIAPQVVEKLGSQIDVAPTILGLLNASYTSHFFGHDLLKSSDERAYLGTYLKVGMLRDKVLTLLGPNKKVEQYQIGPDDSSSPLPSPRADLIRETVSFYQVGSYSFKQGVLIDNGADEIKNHLARNKR